MKIQMMIVAVALGLVAGCSSNNINEPAGAQAVGTRFSDLPPAVQHTIRTQNPTGQIADIDKETRSGRVIYEVQFAEPGINPRLHIA
ncbi:MAG: hypothetical protein ACXWIU_07090, partial [Limisphaerales bacterium]